MSVMLPRKLIYKTIFMVMYIIYNNKKMKIKKNSDLRNAKSISNHRKLPQQSAYALADLAET